VGAMFRFFSFSPYFLDVFVGFLVPKQPKHSKNKNRRSPKEQKSVGQSKNILFGSERDEHPLCGELRDQNKKGKKKRQM
jgi:hypothetical protein